MRYMLVFSPKLGLLTAKQKLHQAKTVILRLDFTYYKNDECAKFYNDQQFSILAKARTPFHLAALEATYITIHQPVLCRHKEFVYALQIPHKSYNHVIVSNVREIRPFWPINVQCTTAILMLFSSIKTELNLPSYYSILLFRKTQFL